MSHTKRPWMSIWDRLIAGVVAVALMIPLARSTRAQDPNRRYSVSDFLARPEYQHVAPRVHAEENNRAAYRARLAKYLAVRSDWIARIANQSDPLLPERLTISDEQLRRALRHYDGYAPSWLHTTRLYDDLPLLFAHPDDPAAQGAQLVDEARFPTILSGEERRILNDALVERRDRLQAAVVRHSASNLDLELCLSAEQVASLIANWPPDPAKYVGIQARAFHFQFTRAGYESVLTILTPAQLEMLGLLHMHTGPMLHVTYDEEGTWRSRVEEFRIQVRDNILSTMQVRIESLERAGLPADQVARLRLAAKGASEELARRLVESGEEFRNPPALRMMNNGKIEPWPATQGRRIHAALPSQSLLDDSPLWQQAYSGALSQLPENPDAQRWERIRAARTELALELLDAELWLQPAQRESLRPVLAKSLMVTRFPDVGREVPRELLWLAHPVARIAADDLATILSPRQLEIWNSLRAYFHESANGAHWLIQAGPEAAWEFVRE